jgi:hypothetical protein
LSTLDISATTPLWTAMLKTKPTIYNCGDPVNGTKAKAVAWLAGAILNKLEG